MDPKGIDRMLRQAELLRLVGLGRTTVWAMERRGEFPARRRLTGRIVAWSEREVLEWMEARQRGPGGAPSAAMAARGAA